MALMHVYLQNGRLAAVVPKPGVSNGDGPLFAGVSVSGDTDGIEGFEIDLDPEVLDAPTSGLRRRSVEDDIERLVLERKDDLPRAQLLDNEGSPA
ncbi:MAG TPA: hypothetical protein VES95_02290 [Dermatophilaceae bacterium]|nr:hypothetical protein [Dermatophilaceae bacterium]